jgi:hypothetical protein
MDDDRLLRMADIARRLGKSVRWLQDHLRAHPCGRFAGRSRIFTEADYRKVLDSFPRDRRPPALTRARARGGPILAGSNGDDTLQELRRLLAEPKRQRP